MVFNNKEYKEIERFKDYYIAKDGEVISCKSRRNCKKGQIKVLHPVINSSGYYQYYLINNKGKKCSPSQHRLLMQTYVDNPNNLPYINHIDGIKTNNSLNNLEWCSPKHNSQHAHKTGLCDSSYCEKPIYYYSLKGEYLGYFKSIAKASKSLKIPSSSIVRVAQGKNSHAKNYIFSYKKSDSVKPYEGKSILKEIICKNLLTNEVNTFPTLAALSKFTGLHRSKFLRRFKSKGLSFIIEHYHITRINY